METSRVAVIIAFFTFLVSSNAQPPPAECAAGHKVRSPECCPAAFPQFMTRAQAGDCVLPPGESTKHRKCDAVCVLTKHKLMAGEDLINKTAFKTFAESQYSAEWKPIIEKVIAACNAEEPNFVGCPVENYIYCFKYMTLKHCPAPLWIDGPDCVAAKTFLEKCPMPAMKPINH